MPPPLIFDAHLDLAMNALEWNRDLTRPLAEMVAPLGIRTAELDESMPRFDLSIIARRDLLPTPAVSQFVTCLKRAVNETLG